MQLQLHHRPKPDFRSCETELRAFEDCDRTKAHLGIAAVRSGRLFGDWQKMIATVSSGFDGLPFIDLGTEIMRGHTVEELAFHSLYDFHPNEIAHGIAAFVIGALFTARGMA